MPLSSTSSSEPTPASGSGPRYDVAVVGLGPVGQSLALLLAQRGHRVVVVEKQKHPYSLPRAVHYDPDISRLLDTVGLAEQMAAFAVATDSYEWQNAERRTMLRFDYSAQGDQGWPESSMFNQPALEQALRQRSETMDNITVLRGCTVVGVSQDPAGTDVGSATLTITSRTLKHKNITARYVIGADGSHSTVREYMNTSVEDLGFFYEWLIVDLVPTEERVWEPSNLQVCDPARPTSSVDGGPGRRRFEFMRMPGDDLDAFNTDETAWALLEPWGVTPETAELERRALYTFQARWVTQWRDGRILLAGDAAHQMPPFYGQGMVSGMRDSASLAWKLDLVLRGTAGDELLDTYASERSVHVRHAIGMSVELGKVICEVDPQMVAARDAHFMAQGPAPEDVLPPIPPERLGAGAFTDPDPAASAVAGLISVQGRLGVNTGSGQQSILADRLAPQTTLLVLDGTAVDAATADATAAAVPAGVDATVLRVLPAGSVLPAAAVTVPVPDAGPPPGTGAASATVVTATDDDKRYLPMLADAGLAGVAIRPDYFYAGGAASAGDAPTMATSLATAYHLVDAHLLTA
ncbi:bifunctional 3-(3-hydroxy-phenyl)propionate/3-hydroxycinnamic acid hydroxylase [Citricoccus sp. NPDC055426]|uniref:bifunctional 3-(3-hydroxy-phenyl)propionate/3-hydroxycinnamic acid hydroxylase MhpA n=1 Tax=Citricoccus sp. NPDC055426 TaxID=3155536 RepID=UPI003419AF7A